MTMGMVKLIEHVNELRRRPGTRRELHRTMAAAGLRVFTSHVPEGAEVALDGTIESIPGGIVVDGIVTSPWTGECRRCLTEIEDTLTSAVREVFETHPTEGETWPLDGDELDLAPMVRDTVLLALPLTPLCESGCRGPAPEVFPAMVESAVPAAEGSGEGSTEPADGDDPPAPRDPRWAALDQLRVD